MNFKLKVSTVPITTNINIEFYENLSWLKKT